jgi:hypothetical protein
MGMDRERKMASWHLVAPNGRTYSGGEAVPQLARLLPAGAPIAALATAFLARQIGPTGGWPGIANGWAASSASGPARSIRPRGTGSPPTTLRAASRYEADAHGRTSRTTPPA